jgi:hypothetical protein
MDIQTENYIYIIREREFIRTNDHVYKIGKTTRDPKRRLASYPKGSEVKFFLQVYECNDLEKKLIKMFKDKFIHRKDYGNEYFEGDVNTMIDIIISTDKDIRIPKKTQQIDNLNNNKCECDSKFNPDKHITCELCHHYYCNGCSKIHMTNMAGPFMCGACYASDQFEMTCEYEDEQLYDLRMNMNIRKNEPKESNKSKIRNICQYVTLIGNFNCHRFTSENYCYSHRNLKGYDRIKNLEQINAISITKIFGNFIFNDNVLKITCNNFPKEISFGDKNVNKGKLISLNLNEFEKIIKDILDNYDIKFEYTKKLALLLMMYYYKPDDTWRLNSKHTGFEILEKNKNNEIHSIMKLPKNYSNKYDSNLCIFCDTPCGEKSKCNSSHMYLQGSLYEYTNDETNDDDGLCCCDDCYMRYIQYNICDDKIVTFLFLNRKFVVDAIHREK